MKSLKVNIVTPEKIAWEAEAVSVTLPGSDGYLGVWANHAPLVTGLVPGVITIKLDDSGKAKLRSGASSTLENVATALRGEYADKDILVFGHTDDQPIKKSKWKDNFELSTQRALSVVRQLKLSGIDADRLVAAGCGEFQPIRCRNINLPQCKPAEAAL